MKLNYKISSGAAVYLSNGESVTVNELVYVFIDGNILQVKNDRNESITFGSGAWLFVRPLSPKAIDTRLPIN